MADTLDLDTSRIKEWRSIVTLIVFVLTNLAVLFPFHLPLPVPCGLYRLSERALLSSRILSPRPVPAKHESTKNEDGSSDGTHHYVWIQLPVNFVTAPVAADLFLLAILAIGRKEVHDGTVGADHIAPIDIMVFFITLAYIAISIDASGLLRYLTLKVLHKAGSKGKWLFLYLYSFFFVLASLVGNDPIVLSGTAFLAYMTRVSSNIKHPRAWIHTQFAVANTGSAVLVSSNPTNLVLAGAFSIKFIVYTANVIVPVVATAVALFPFLLFLIFRSEELIPKSIELHELSDEHRARPPVNPNIPFARGLEGAEAEGRIDSEEQKNLQLEEIMNPYLDKKSATFGTVVMAATLITILVLNASSSSGQEHPVFWITLPAAVIMLCWDLTCGWIDRNETRQLARAGREEVKRARTAGANTSLVVSPSDSHEMQMDEKEGSQQATGAGKDERGTGYQSDIVKISQTSLDKSESPPLEVPKSDHLQQQKTAESTGHLHQQEQAAPQTLQSLVANSYQWCQDTFPTVMAVLKHLPLPLVPFSLAMFVLVQALVTKGWVPVFAHGWDHWVDRTGVVGAIGGMGFLSVILCNFAGTNIGTTILLCRVVQAWVEIHQRSGEPISQRTFWATVYSMAIGLNYGAFSTAFSASLAGLLWRDILARKGIHVGRLEFARVNVPIIAMAMIVGLTVLVGEVYITRSTSAYYG